MPLNFKMLEEKLKQKINDFKKFDQDKLKELINIEKAISQNFELSYDELKKALDKIKVPTGARPSEEYERGVFLPFQGTFKNKNEMIKWAAEILTDKVVGGSDGSQIYPTNDISIPVGLVQVACYVNEYNRNQPHYNIETDIELLSPVDLTYLDPISGRESISQEPVNTCRFNLEMNIITEQMKKYDKQNPRNSNVFFFSDGSLILSFLLKMGDQSINSHLNALGASLVRSRSTKYPLIGYIDSSAAKDVVRMIETLDSKPKKASNYITDAHLLEYFYKTIMSKNGDSLPYLKWGVRTCAFICDRDDEIYRIYQNTNGLQKGLQKIAFFYIKLSSEMLARVEFPEWCLHEEGMVEKIANIIRAQAAIESGYPYVIDKCHHTAIIRNDDKEKFLRYFQAFTKNNGLPMRIRNKARSKRIRY